MAHLLFNCVSVTTENTTFYDPTNKGNVSSLVIADKNHNSLCFLDIEVIRALYSSKIGKFNVTYRNLMVDIEPPDIYTKENVDIMLSAKPIDMYLMNHSDAHWFRDEYGCVILSSLFVEPPKMVNMLKMFAIDVWITLLLTIIVIITYTLIIDKFQYGKSFGYIALMVGILNKFFMISRNLLNQGLNNNHYFILNFWALLSVIFITCFSGNILSTLITHDIKPINSFDELMNSDLKIYVVNRSYVDYGIRWAEAWNDPKFIQLRSVTSRITYLPNSFQSSLVDNAVIKLAKDNKAVLIGDSLNLRLKQLELINASLAIGEEKYNLQYMAYPINKWSEHRQRIRKIMQRLTEVGVNIRQYALVFLIYEFRGIAKLQSNESSADHSVTNSAEVNSIDLKLVRELFFSILMFYSFSAIVLSAEIFYFFMNGKYTFGIEMMIKR